MGFEGMVGTQSKEVSISGLMGMDQRRYAPNVMGHMEPCRAQLAILSNVESTYSALFEGVSKLSWFEPRFAICVMGSAGLVESVGMVEGDEAGRDE